MDCEWKINPTAGNKLYLEFSHFELEHSYTDGEGSVQCDFDYVQIDERDSENNLIKGQKYCNEMPKSIITSNAVVIK